MAWSHDDCFLLTAGMDGAIYEWELKSLKRSRENVIKGCQYSGVVTVKDSPTFFGVGSDRKLKELDDAIVIKVINSLTKNHPYFKQINLSCSIIIIMVIDCSLLEYFGYQI